MPVRSSVAPSKRALGESGPRSVVVIEECGVRGGGAALSCSEELSVESLSGTSENAIAPDFARDARVGLSGYIAYRGQREGRGVNVVLRLPRAVPRESRGGN